jgi:hypothetical protein
MADTDASRVRRLPRWVWILYVVMVAVICVDFFIRRGAVWTLVLIAGSAGLGVPMRRLVRRT